MSKPSAPAAAGKSDSSLFRFNIMPWRGRGTLVPVVRLHGAIGMAMPLRPGLTLAALAAKLDKAFSYRQAPAVAIVVNSPGGSPVQSHLIFRRIRALAEEKETPVIVFCEDVAASGGYMVALAGDEIYADPSSIVGSIGVVSAGFGFDRLIDKVGIDRRVYTAGKSKYALDPFQPERADDVRRLKAIQRDVHETFIALVRERRGARLKGRDGELFNGEFWSGGRAQALGLVDGLGDMRTVLRGRFGEDVKLKAIGGGGGWLRRRLAFTGRPAAPGLEGWADELIAAVEARGLWARYGL